MGIKFRNKVFAVLINTELTISQLIDYTITVKLSIVVQIRAASYASQKKD